MLILPLASMKLMNSKNHSLAGQGLHEFQFATKAEVENLKAEMLDRISALQQTFLSDPNQRNSSNPSAIISLP